MASLVPWGRRFLARGKYKHLTRAEVVELLSGCRSPKLRLLIRVLWNTGLRISEVVGDSASPNRKGLLVQDLVRRGGAYWLRVRRLKRRKVMVDEVSIPTELGLAIEDYIRLYKLDRDDKLFVGDRRSAYLALRRLGKKVLNKEIHPHMFRHGFVYELIYRGASPYIVSKLAGHTELSSALSYFHPSEEELRHRLEEIAL